MDRGRVGDDAAPVFSGLWNTGAALVALEQVLVYA